LHSLDRLEPVGRFGDHLDLLIDLEELAKAGTDERLVVGDDDADAQRRTVSRGRRAFTMKPPRLPGPASRVPP
jgi:hypothetical protein